VSQRSPETTRSAGGKLRRECVRKLGQGPCLDCDAPCAPQCRTRPLGGRDPGSHAALPGRPADSAWVVDGPQEPWSR
jgi:hypothetical protein